MTDMEILQLSDKCGVTAVSKHEWDGKRFNHTDDLLDGDFAGLIQFARLLIAGEREACAKLCEDMWHEWLDSPSPEENVEDCYRANKPDADDCAKAIRARGEI
jgi:hypothetical protein